MDSFIDRIGFELSKGGKFRPLPPNPDLVPERTVLIHIDDPSPRDLEASVKKFSRVLTDEEILKELVDDAGWQGLPSHSDPNTSICVDASGSGESKPALVVFHIGSAYPADCFMGKGASADEAILLCDGEAGLWHAEWVGSGPRKTVKVKMSGEKLNLEFVLGIIVQRKIGRGRNPIFLDPKLENNG